MIISNRSVPFILVFVALLTAVVVSLLYPAPPPADKPNETDMSPVKKDLIALYIHDLEDVDAHPMMVPGYIDFNSSVQVQLLVQQGEDAIEPLLFCLACDPRKTRALDGSRIVGVEEPAYAAIQSILKTQSQFPPLKEPYSNCRPSGEQMDRVALAELIRVYWNKARKLTFPERWYATLQDDNAKPEAWAEAAGDIVMSDSQNVGYGFGGLVFEAVYHPHKPGEPEPIVFRGESLRSATNPSVSDLLNKRPRETMTHVTNPDWSQLETPKKLATALGRWDGKNQIETLRWYCGELQKIILPQTDDNGPGEIDDLIKTYLARVEAGDPTALSEYAEWIRHANVKKLIALDHMYGPFFFSPVWSYPDNPAMVSLAKWLFENPQSPWSIGKSGVDPTWVVNSTHDPLVALPSFRALLLQQLRNTQVVGNTTITAPDMVTVTLVYGSGERSFDPDLPPPGKMNLRLCDYIAFRFSKIRGAPRCEPYWPQVRKDAAIQQTILFLQRYGDRLGHRSTSQEEELGFRDPALSFPKLDHPATQEDVAAGRAIFSMEGKGERKIVTLPGVSPWAKWTTLKDYPTTQGLGDQPIGTALSKVKGYDQDVAIWQAEDVLIDGKWQRYYGCVTKNGLAVAPGEEIHFESDDFYQSGIDGWGFRIDLLDNQNHRGWFGQMAGKVDAPLTTTISIQNLNGNARSTSVFKHDPGESNATELGLDIHIEYNDQPLKRGYAFPTINIPWDPVPTKAPLQVEIPPIPAEMASLETAALVRLDLAQGYDLTKPGFYRVTVNFKKGGLFDSGGNLYPVSFQLSK